VSARRHPEQFVAVQNLVFRPTGVGQGAGDQRVQECLRCAAADSLPAVQSLVDSAYAASAAGRFDDAAADLERALRLQPENAVLSRELALVRRDQAQWDQAVSVAMRSNSFASEDLQEDNWRLIAECRRAVGDEEGALEAEERAKRIR